MTRRALRMKPIEVCRATGISPNTYSQWEGAKRRPRLDEARLLRRILGYSLDWIYEGERRGLSLDLATKIAEAERTPLPPKAA